MARRKRLSYDANNHCIDCRGLGDAHGCLAKASIGDSTHGRKGELAMAKGKGAPKKEVKKPKKDKATTSSKDGKSK
jgi:hypothetical protein